MALARPKHSSNKIVTPEVITLPYRFTPREYQYPVLRYFDETPKRQRAFLLAHRRTGKDLLAWNILIKESQKRVGTYWHVLPLLNQARKIIWTGSTKDGIPFLDFIPPPLIASKRDDDMSIRLKNGSLIQLVGADRIDSLIGSNPVGVTLSEFAVMKPSVWDYLSPILNENDGWAMFITTPRGRNHAFDLFKSMVDAVNNKGANYFLQVLTVDDTRKPLLDNNGEPIIGKDNKPVMVPIMSPEAIQEQRDLNIPEEIIQQEYYCVPENALVERVSGVFDYIKNIRIGDQVLTNKSLYRPVTRIWKRPYKGLMCHISTFGNNRDLECTPNHPVRVYNKETGAYTWKPAGKIEVKDLLVIPKMAEQKDELPFLNDLAPHWACVLAWYICDGSLLKNAVEFTLGKDKKNEEPLLESLQAIGYTPHRIPDKTSNTNKIFVYSKYLNNLLHKIAGKGSVNKHIPFAWIREQEENFFKILLQGDGCQYTHKRWSYCTVSPTLANQVQRLGIALGYKVTIAEYNPKKNNIYKGREIKHRHSVWRLNISLPESKGIGARLGICSEGMYAPVRSIKQVPYKGFVYNLSVQYDESYVANGRVVHNCSFEAGMVGSYYTEAIAKLEKEGRAVKDLSIFDPSKPVYTAWDIGFTDSMSIWYFQVDKKKINVIEYDEFVGRSLIECCYIVQAQWDKLRETCGWSDDQVSKTMALYQHHENYKYKTHFGPHDLDQTDISIGVTRRSVAKQHGIKFKLVPRTDVQSGIDLVRRILINVTFELTRTNDGLRALKEYHKEWDEKAQMFSDKPCHDWSSHGSDAFRYLAQAVVTYIDKAMDRPTLANQADFKVNPLMDRIKKYDEEDDEKPRGRLKRSRREQLAITEYDIYNY